MPFCCPGAAAAAAAAEGMIHRSEGGHGGVGWREGGLDSVGEACLRFPELPAVSPSPPNCAQPGTTRSGEESPRGLLTRQAPKERSSRGSEGNQKREPAGAMKAQALCLTAWDSSPFLSGQNGALHDSFNPPGLTTLTLELPFTVYKHWHLLREGEAPPSTFWACLLIISAAIIYFVLAPCCTFILPVKLSVSPRSKLYYYPYFTDQETEARRNESTGLWSHN